MDGSADGLKISEDYVEGNIEVMYQFTDLYGKEYWTPSLALGELGD